MNLIPNIDVSVDINSLAPVFIDHILNVNDTNSRTFSVTLYANNQKINFSSNDFTAKAAVSVNNVLLDDNVTATVQSTGAINVTVDNKYLTLMPGVMKIQLTITSGADVIVTPLPILARVTSDLAQTAQILPDSHSSYAEIVAEIVAARGNFDNLSEAITGKVSFVTVTSADDATQNGTIYYVNGSADKYTLIPTSTVARQVQLRIDSSGKLLIRKRYANNSGTFPAWGNWTDISANVDPEDIREIVLQYLKEHGIDLTGVERTDNRVSAINAQSDNEHYPTAGAVYDYAAPKYGLNYLENQLGQLTNEVNQKANASDIPDVTGKADKSDTYTKNEVDTKLSGKADNSDIPDISGKADKATTLGGYGITDAYTKVQANFELAKKADLEDIPDVSGKEDTSHKVSAIIDSVANNTTYPSTLAIKNYVSAKANKSDTYTKSEVDAAIQTAIGTIETQLSQV